MNEKASAPNPEPAPEGPDDEAPLPEFLRPLFWEVDFDWLRVRGHERYVIERVLEYGDDQAIRWLLRTVDPHAIADVVRRSRKISRNTATLWALVLDIPREQVQCLSKRYRLTPDVF
jgi:hypothetical protein